MTTFSHICYRVAIICGRSKPQQWCHVESQSNTADDLSRGLTAYKIMRNQRWLKGPDFSYTWIKKCWPTGHEICTSILENDKEVKHDKAKVFTTSKTDDENKDMIGKLLVSYSSWFRLKKAIAYLLRIAGWQQYWQQYDFPSRTKRINCKFYFLTLFHIQLYCTFHNYITIISGVSL